MTGPLILPERQVQQLLAAGMALAVGQKLFLKGAGEVVASPSMELPGVPMPDLIEYTHTPRNRAERRAKKVRS